MTANWMAYFLSERTLYRTATPWQDTAFHWFQGPI